MRYLLTIAYDGTHYSGWQVQSNATCIQPLIQHSLQTALRTTLELTGSSRTDAGVHALGQIAHFDVPFEIDLILLRRSLNALLPADIRILEVRPVSDTFHARYSATSKVYHYRLHLDPVLDPFKRLYCHPIFGSFDRSRLKAAVGQFIGTKDFTSFANVKKGTVNPIRTLYRLDVVDEPGGMRLEFEGNGFLYKMVRNLTGALLAIGSYKLNPDEIESIFSAKDRTQAPPTAPAKALTLMQIHYGLDEDGS